MVTNLLFILLFGMLDDLWDEVEKDVFEEGDREDEFYEIVTLFQDVKDIT